ncbi:hypothetical protein B0H15DRAFT_823044, partial [Mycena belliarum]
MPFKLHTLSVSAVRRYSAVPNLKPAPAQDALSLLEAAAAFVPKALANEPAQLSLWNAVLPTAIADMRWPQPRPARLVVCGTDTAGARDLVTALLHEPFASDAQPTRTLRERWRSVPPGQKSLSIEYGSAASDVDGLRLPLPFLNQFPLPMQFIEAGDPAIFHAADVAVLVTRLDELHTLNITRSDALVVVNMEAEEIESERHASAPRSTAVPCKYLFISPSQALSALAVLQESSGSPEAFQRYQTAFLASRMPTLIHALHTILAPIESAFVLRNRTALAQVRSVLAACRAAIEDAKTDMDRLAAGVSDLQGLAEEERAKVHHEVFGLPDEHAVDRALKDVTSGVAHKIGLMRWWRTMWSIDEITMHITTSVRRLWCVGLEKELIFHSGRLERMQRAFTERGLALVAHSNTRVLHSPVLLNTLRQLSDAPNFRVAPVALADPVSVRGDQILNGPTARLHVTGHRALVGTGVSAFAGALIGWAGWICSFLNVTAMGPVLEPGTAMATGTLVTLVGLRWSASHWDKGRRRWLEDFGRVAGGLKQDLTEALDKTMDNQVLVVAQTGCSELSKILGKRKSELEDLQHDLDSLATAVDEFERRK